MLRFWSRLMNLTLCAFAAAHPLCRRHRYPCNVSKHRRWLLESLLHFLAYHFLRPIFPRPWHDPAAAEYKKLVCGRNEIEQQRGEDEIRCQSKTKRKLGASGGGDVAHTRATYARRTETIDGQWTSAWRWTFASFSSRLRASSLMWWNADERDWEHRREVTEKGHVACHLIENLINFQGLFAVCCAASATVATEGAHSCGRFLRRSHIKT